MKKRLSLYVMLCLLLAATVTSCNKDNKDTDEGISVTSTSTTLVSAFSLGKNNRLVHNLDSVHFTIDQERNLIYNADSLPKGTDVTHTLVLITFPSRVKEAEFHVTGGKVMTDSTFQYTSPTRDSIDFTGKVTLKVTSFDETSTRTYHIKVNVHQMEPDSLYFNPGLRRDIPGMPINLKGDKTVKVGDEYLCMVNDNNTRYYVALATNPGSTWSRTNITLPFTPQVSSLTATDDALYVLDSKGELFQSSDYGMTWTDCGVAWHSIQGAFGAKLLGVLNDGTLKHDEYPRPIGFEPQEVENDFPVSASSDLIAAHNEWTDRQQKMLAGGRLQNGKRSKSVWGYDGKSWGKISNDAHASNSLPELEAPALIPYMTYSVDTITQRAKGTVSWLIMGGRLQDSTVNTTTYVSYNQGITWSKAEQSLQQPDYMPAFYGAQAFVVEETLSKARRINVTRPITSWPCPYIYIMGGYGNNDACLNSIWKGVINRRAFKPLH